MEWQSERMEESSSKRKKRKTRKCLDEMRKRSRLCIDTDVSKMSKGVEVRLSQPLPLSQKKSRSNCITARRLTLTMFHKAVCSETITRPALAEISHKPFLNVNNILKGKTASSATVPIAEPKFVTTSTSFNLNRQTQTKCMELNCNLMDQILTDTNSNNELNNCSDNSLSSYVIFSPVNQSADTDIFEDSNDLERFSTPVSSTSHNTNSYNLYDQFMSKIPKYIEDSASILLQDEVMMKTRTFLHNIYVEHQHNFDQKVNYVKINKDHYNISRRAISPIATIVQNPADYIKLGQLWDQHSTIHEISSCSSNTQFSSLAACSPEGSSSPLKSNSLAPHSPLMPFTPHTRSASPVVLSVLRDTPEYAYYPHKLNQ